jgi:hypothetical protein
MSTTNWFLYVVKEAFLTEDEIMYTGEIGVGRCSMDTGIMEAPYGMMYVIPDDFVIEYHKKKGLKRVCSSVVRDAVESYFGVKLK